MTKTPGIGAVVIGRNEGPRLKSCLASLTGRVKPLVYVDSGSTDGSIDTARDFGAYVVELDPARPFTAARARDEGYAVIAAMKTAAPDVVQFVDGDCVVHPDWLDKGRAALTKDPRLGLVTGWRQEMYPEDSIYNAMAEVEWHRPAGAIVTCGGDMMVRREAYDAVGGFRADVIAAEDDEFCRRLGKAHWRLKRLPAPMTCHDINMTRFSQWWARAVRSGHGFAQVGALHPEFFVAERRRVWIYALVLPFLALAGLWLGRWLTVLALATYAFSYQRSVQGLVRRDNVMLDQALKQAGFLTLSKFPNLIGMVRYTLRRWRKADMTIIEYKQARHAP